MDLGALKKVDLQTYDDARLKETAVAIRRELAKMRLDVFGDKKAHVSKAKHLKKNLARVLTLRTQLTNSLATR